MTNRELIEKLKTFPPDNAVMIKDRDGTPREINVGPYVSQITPQHADDCADCEGKVWDRITLIGFGSY
jgi:hypothetical protein